MAGDADVVNAARSTVAHDWRANARTRLGEMQESVVQRHARQGDLAHLIEPDLKEAHGGLRDMSVLRALTAAWLTDRPHGEVDEAYERILDVRDAIHVVTGRGRDRLTRDDQDACAALLGYTDADDLLTDLSTSARTIAYAVDGTLRRAMQSQRARTLRVGPRRPQLAPLGYGLYRHDGEAVLGPSADLSSDPIIPLRAAVVAARGGIPLSPTTLKNLAATAPALPEPWPEVARNLFADLLASGPGLVTVWEGLDLAGVVERWIPEWQAVRSRPQRNAVHRHTVDRHLIETVVAASGMVRDVARPDLLMLAAVLHDIGKVPGSQDHSVTGAELADTVLRRMGVTDADRAHRRAAGPRAPHPRRAGHPPRPRGPGDHRRALGRRRRVGHDARPAARPHRGRRVRRRAQGLERLAGRSRPAPLPGLPHGTHRPAPKERGLSSWNRSRPCRSPTTPSTASRPESPTSPCHPSVAPTASTSSTATAPASSPTRPACSPRTASSCARPSSAPSTASPSTSGGSTRRAARPRCPR